MKAIENNTCRMNKMKTTFPTSYSIDPILSTFKIFSYLQKTTAVVLTPLVGRQMVLAYKCGSFGH